MSPLPKEKGTAAVAARFAVAVSLVIFLCCNLTFAQVLDNRGREFILGFLHNYPTHVPDIELHLTGDTATTVNVEYPVNSPTFTTAAPIEPGVVTVVSLPAEASYWPDGSVENNAVRAYADKEFVCYMINRAAYSSDAALALPVDAMNTTYIVMSYTSHEFSAYDGGEFVVVAGYDNTEITIVPINDLRGGYSAGTPFNVTLNRGDGFCGLTVATQGPGCELTGTTVSADRPVAVTNGHRVAMVPPGTGAADHIFEVAQPLQTWGDTILVANLPNRPAGSVYRIIVAEDSTTVSMDGAPLGSIDRNQFIETAVIDGSHVFTGDNAIFVGQFMTGDSYPGAVDGDPALGNMIPCAQYVSDYTFSTVGGAQFNENYVTIVTENDDVATITLDDSPVGAGNFTPVVGTGFSYAVVALSQGTHTTSSNGVHGITVEGYNSYDSYIYPGGARFEFIHPVEDTIPPACDVQIAGDVATGSATDDGPDDAGIHSVYLEPGSDNLQIEVDPFVPGDPVVTFTITLIDPFALGSGTVTAKDLSGNTCSAPVTLVVGGPQVATDPVFLLCPGADEGFRVTLTDEFGDPIVGNSTVWVRFFDYGNLQLCSPRPDLDSISPLGPSNDDGVVTFYLGAGNCDNSCQAHVMVEDVTRAIVPVKSFDIDGNLLVTLSDFDTLSLCCDYNDNGEVGYNDQDLFNRHLNHHCDLDPCERFSALFRLSKSTGLFPGDTTTLGLILTNNNPEPCYVGHVAFYSSGFGNDLDTTKVFDFDYDRVLEPGEEKDINAFFTVPGVGAGCLFAVFDTDCCTTDVVLNKCVESTWHCTDAYANCYQFNLLFDGSVQQVDAIESYLHLPVGFVYNSLQMPAIFPVSWPDSVLFEVCTPVMPNLGDTAAVYTYLICGNTSIPFQNRVVVTSRTGDCDGNCITNVSDAVRLISYIFGGGDGCLPPEAGDVNCDDLVNISDVVYLIAYIFGGGPEPCLVGD